MQIQLWAPSILETVARSKDRTTRRCIIRQFLGSTVNKIPEGACPICENAPTQHRLIELPD